MMGGKGSGRKPQPIERKRRLGNPGKRKLPSSPLLAVVEHFEMPEPHRPLSTSYGRRMWDGIWKAGASWLKPNLDAEIVLMVCEMLDERIQLRQRVLMNADAWRDRRALREIDRQISSLLGQLGFSPTDRAHLGAMSSNTHELSNLRSRIEARRQAAG